MSDEQVPPILKIRSNKMFLFTLIQNVCLEIYSRVVLHPETSWTEQVDTGFVSISMHKDVFSLA